MQPQFRSLRGLAISMYIMLTIAAVLGLVMIPLALNLRSVVHDEAFGVAFPGNRAVLDAADAVGAVELLLVVTLVTFVLFIIWMWRAAKNVGIFGRARQRFGAGFAIGGWFIPSPTPSFRQCRYLTSTRARVLP